MEDLRLESRFFDFKFFVCSTVLPHYHAALLDKRASFYIGSIQGFFFFLANKDVLCINTSIFLSPVVHY